MNLQIDNNFYLTIEGEISLFQREENIFTKEYINVTSFYITNINGYKIHYNYYDKIHHFKLNNFEIDEDDELDYIEFRYIDNLISLFINNKQFYLFSSKEHGLILKNNKTDSLNICFIEYADDLIDDLIKIRNNHFERKIIPNDVYTKSLFLQTSMKRGEENIFYNHIIMNEKTNLIPKIYKSTSREIIMKKYPFIIENLIIIDDFHYKIKNKSYIFIEGNLRKYIFDKMFNIICELLKLGITHNDYNLGNFLISKDLKEILIVDFGQSYFFKNEKDLSSATFLGDKTKTLEDVIVAYRLYVEDIVNNLIKT